MTIPTIARGHPIDVARLVESRMLLTANSGAGKSWALRRILEQTHGHVQHIIIDPEDEFHTLREKFDYILAGRHGGDCPAEPRSAELLARRLLELGSSAVLGIGELKVDARQMFVRKFLEAMISSPRSLWRPALIVVDEAHMFAHQTQKAESLGAIIDLMTRGRKRGFCGILATQRISKLHKDAAAETNNKLLGRAALDVDQRRVADELGFSTKSQTQALRSLKPGEFYAFGPALSDQVVRIKVGPVSTTHPKIGERSTLPTPPRASIKKVLAELSDLPEQAAEEARSLEAMRAEVQTLRSKLRIAESGRPQVDPKAVDQAYAKGRQDRENELRSIVVEFTKGRLEETKTLEAIVETMKTTSSKLMTDFGSAPVRRLTKPVRVPKQSNPVKSVEVSQNADTGISKPKQRILDALMWLKMLGVESAPKVQVAFLADQSPRSSGYANNLSSLRTSDLISYPSSGCLGLTEAGVVQASSIEAPLTEEDLQEAVLSKLSRPQGRIVKTLIAVYPESMSKQDLAQYSDQSATSSGYANNLSFLRSLGLIDYPSSGYVIAQPLLFLG